MKFHKTPITSELLKLATEARLRAYAPYSSARIGSAVRMEDGSMFAGCNIENASYGGTVCAERVAIWKAISEKSKQKIEEILVVSDFPKAWPPCGFCRQVIAEFATNQTLVHVMSLQGDSSTFTFEEILPMAFSPTHLNDVKT